MIHVIIKTHATQIDVVCFNVQFCIRVKACLKKLGLGTHKLFRQLSWCNMKYFISLFYISYMMEEG